MVYKHRYRGTESEEAESGEGWTGGKALSTVYGYDRA